MLYACRDVQQLPSQRYFYPAFDGLPGGLLGYDYAGNPCGFVTIHFGAHFQKPSDSESLLLANQILGRHLARNVVPRRRRKAGASRPWLTSVYKAALERPAIAGVGGIVVRGRRRFRSVVSTRREKPRTRSAANLAKDRSPT